jgi:hypothetical protein
VDTSTEIAIADTANVHEAKSGKKATQSISFDEFLMDILQWHKPKRHKVARRSRGKSATKSDKKR